MNRTLVIVVILFLLGGLQAIHAFIPAQIYALINAVLTAFEAYMQVPTIVATMKARRLAESMK